MTRSGRVLRVAASQRVFAPTLEGNLAAILRTLAQAAGRRADAVLFPECALTGYSYDFRSLNPRYLREALGAVGGAARRHGIYALLGSPVFAGRRLYNCLVVFDRRGRPIHCYAKCQLTERDRKSFAPGDAVALFEIDGVRASSIICHERRYPELVRLGVMAGARILFHPNAGLDRLSVSREKRHGRDGIAVRAFENAIYYVFANSVGPQGGGLWSAGDSKIVGPDLGILAQAGHRGPDLIVADLDLSRATGKYASESRLHPRFLSPHWNAMVAQVRRRARDSVKRFGLRGL
jgi:predicted amidohydrolase